jgi:small subunit ribosomal protein S19
MSRSLKKGPFTDSKLLKKVSLASSDSKQAIKTWSRSSVITPEMVGYSFDVHNGKEFIRVQASEEMVGHKLGEFSPTKKFLRHGGKIQKELEKKGKKK